jgi:hypothetical protein
VHQAGAGAPGDELEELKTVPNWTSIGLNAAGSAAACASVTKLTGTAHADWTGWGVGIGLCVAVNLLGLLQQSALGAGAAAPK